MHWVFIVAILLALSSILSHKARGDDFVPKDKSQWADVSPERKKWFESQKMTPAARERLQVPWASCCDNGDVFRTRFRVGVKNDDVWEYLDGDTWRVIPPDIIQDVPSLDSEPILFRSPRTGTEYCFFLPPGGG